MRSIKTFGSALIFMIICTFLVSACSKKNQTNVVDDGLVINSISFGLGGEPDKTLVTYNFNIWNKTRKSILIQSIEPILSEDIHQMLLDNGIKIEVNKTINENTSKIFTGSFSLDTQGLNKQAIEKLNIRLNKFRIITQQEIGIETH